MNLTELEEIIQKGESDVLEFKKSTFLLHAIAETLCGFFNGKGGKVLIGVTSEKKPVGQHVSDHTLQEIAAAFAKFEPPATIDLDRILVKQQKEVIVLTALPRKTDVPYTWEGRAYQRVGSTTSRMPQQVYQRLLFVIALILIQVVL
ncbi:MAG: helix-turn-helix domain-containing protein [Chlamydiales bacterium]